MSVSSLDNATAPVFGAIEAAYRSRADAVHGFEVMLGKAGPGVEATLADVRDTDQRQADELTAFLASHGRDDALQALAKHLDELPRDVFDGVHTIPTVQRGEIGEIASRIAVRHRALDT
ncbi:MAG: hypothetical protein RIC18_07680 [Hoeflea sp.]|uniref:hypothetical protein n=1 Tax=Hoeflea sp. TaxID=1940281 RepID=UPI0032EE5CF2